MWEVCNKMMMRTDYPNARNAVFISCYNNLMQDYKKNQPSKDILEAFRINESPVHLEGGQGTSYRYGNIVVKPETDFDEANWIAQTLSELNVRDIRIPMPIKSSSGQWIYKGWSAHTFIEGETTSNKWKEKIQTSKLFHIATKKLIKPSFIGNRTHPWEVADKMIWGEIQLTYGEELRSIVSKLEPLLKPVVFESQVIHGDLTGNILFHQNEKPAVIDFSPYWRPREYAIAIIIVDSIVWDNAPINLISELEDTVEMNQLLIKACMWRIKTTEEFIRQYGGKNINELEQYHTFIEALLKRKYL